MLHVRAWKRIRRVAKRFDIDVTEDDWHELVRGGKAKRTKTKNRA